MNRFYRCNSQGNNFQSVIKIDNININTFYKQQTNLKYQIKNSTQDSLFKFKNNQLYKQNSDLYKKPQKLITKLNFEQKKEKVKFKQSIDGLSFKSQINFQQQKQLQPIKKQENQPLLQSRILQKQNSQHFQWLENINFNQEQTSKTQQKIFNIISKRQDEKQYQQTQLLTEKNNKKLFFKNIQKGFGKINNQINQDTLSQTISDEDEFQSYIQQEKIKIQ